MDLVLIVLGAGLFGCLLPALVGYFGSRRRLGFGWAFLLSLLFTPIVGLICCLLSDPLPAGSEPRTGCIGGCLSMFGLLLLGFLAMLAAGLLLL